MFNLTDIFFYFLNKIRCTWPVCSDNCHGLTDPQMHGLECGILCIRSNPKATENIDALFDYYRSDALFTLRCLLLQWRYPDRWNKILKFESHDEQRVGTRYYKYIYFIFL